MKTIYFSIIFLFLQCLHYPLNAQMKYNSNQQYQILQKDTVEHSLPKDDLGKDGKDDGATGDDEEIEIPGIPNFPSPKVTEMMKYTDFPVVDQYGGVPIQIPIYEINSNGLTHDINLSYHSGGITVVQEATWVGLGWNLQVGGFISRIVKDLPDDEVRTYNYTVPGNISIGYTVKEYGWLNNPNMIENFPDIELGDGTYKNSLHYKWNEHGESGNAGIAFRYLNFSNRFHNQVKHDCEPDIYYINVGNINTKFLFDFEGIPRLINPEQDLDIKCFHDDAISSTRITSFIIKDNLGVEYHFGGQFTERTTIESKSWGGVTESLEVTNSGSPFWLPQSFGEYTISTPYNSVWFLEKIVSPKSNEISFNYIRPANPCKIEIPINKCQTFNSLGLSNSWNKTISIKQEINTCYLESIEFQNGVINFSISPREDFENGYRLDKISIDETIISNESILQYDFNYHYMNPTGNYKTKRLILDKLTQNELKEYEFKYYAGTLPEKDSYQQDFWGYYSTKSTGLVPKIYVYPLQSAGNRFRCYPITAQTGHIINGSDRTLDENNILTGVLLSIKYPTNGKTTYQFEPHEYYDALFDGNIKGGGVRISQILKKDENDNTLLKKCFEYTVGNHSSGILIYDLAFATPTNYCPADNETDYYYLWKQDNWSEAQKHEYFTVRFTHNVYPSGNLDGYKVGYKNVAILEEGNGKIIREYHPPQNYLLNSTMVKNTPINAWGNSILDISSQALIYPEYSANFNTYYKYCYKDTENIYWWIHKSPFNYNNPTKIQTNYCSSSYDETVETYDNLKYFGGGFGGQFTPLGYYSYSLGCDKVNIFGINAWDFEAYKSSTFYYYSDLLSEWSTLLDNTYKQSSTYLNEIYWGFVEEDGGTNIFPYPPLTTLDVDELIYSKLKSEIFFKEGESLPCKKKEYFYEIQGIPDEPTFGIVFSEQFVVPFFNMASPSDAASFDLGAAYFYSVVHSSYFLNKAWAKYFYKTGCSAFLDNIVQTDYFTDGNVVKNTNYYYEDHYLISSITEDQSNGTVINESFKYPFNYQNGIYSTMTNDNMYNYLIEKLIIRNGFVLDGDINTFKTDDGIIVPNKHYEFKTTHNISVAECEFDGLVPNENYWNEKASYDSYDNGNLVQYHLKDGIDISFIWSYNNQYPVIAAKNIEQSILEASVNGIQSNLESFLAQLGDLSTQNSVENWKSFNLLLREAEDLVDASISTFTYLPLVGISSKTDPIGNTTYYVYDNFNRLETIKDKNNSIIKHVDYHYHQYNLNAEIVHNSSYTHGEIANISSEANGGSGSYSYQWSVYNDGLFASGTDQDITFQLSNSGYYYIILKVTDNETAYSMTKTSSINADKIAVTFIDTVENQNSANLTVSEANLQSPWNETVTMQFQIQSSSTINESRIIIDGIDPIMVTEEMNDPYHYYGVYTIEVPIEQSNAHCEIRIDGPDYAYAWLKIISIQNNNTTLEEPKMIELSKSQN